MGLLPQVSRIILREHKRRQITGDFLMVARQTTFLDEREADRLLKSEGIPAHSKRFVEYDTNTRSAVASKTNFLTDKSFISFFSDSKLLALDVSAYEGADVICDLNRPIESSLFDITDFIYNGSCLDNIFNPAQAIVNLSRMLRQNGRIVHLEHGTHVNCPYIAFNPAWFFDYYMLNRFRRCNIYVAYFNRLMGPWSVYEWLPCVPTPTGVLYDPAFLPPRPAHFMIIVIAEKSHDSTAELIPNQAQYRNAAEQEKINKAITQQLNMSQMGGNTLITPGQNTIPRILAQLIAKKTHITCNAMLKVGLWPHFKYDKTLRK